MLLYRISSSRFAGDLSGNGAKLYGGRWNEKGVPLVYFASSRAMAVMELLAHLRPDDLQADYIIAVFEVPDNKICKIDTELLPDDWKEEERKPLLAKLCRRFINEGKFPLLEVPSVLIEEESNFLLNPMHPETSAIKFVSKRLFSFDHRLKN